MSHSSLMPPADLLSAVWQQHWLRSLCSKAAAGQPQILALSGAQGAGKSTLAARLAGAFQQAGISAVEVSLDDYYFSKSQRQQLAATVHPLLRWRGVPGTHHIERLAADLSAHLAGRPVAWPQFDKATDDCRADRPATSHSLLILEGWCLGALPQSDEALAIPVNRLEQQQDPDGRFRQYVNQQLAHWYQPLWPRFDALLFLAAPDWPTVLDWRQQQETALWQARGLGMSTTELQFFMQLFERYSRAMLAGQVQSGSCRLSLRADRTPLL